MKDFYLRGGYGFTALPLFARVSALLIYHDFSAQRLAANYGNEWDAQLEGQIDSGYSGPMPRIVTEAASLSHIGGAPRPRDQRGRNVAGPYHGRLQLFARQRTDLQPRALQIGQESRI